MPRDQGDRVEELLEEKRQDIKKRYTRRGDAALSLQFVVEHDVKHSLWSLAEFRRIFPRYTEDERVQLLEHHVVIFTILIYGHWPVNASQFRRHFLGRPEMTDEDLPFQDEKLKDLPADVRHHFSSYQYIFKPFKIIQTSSPKVHDIQANQRWPFLKDPREIGKGGFGKVFETEIAKHCFEDNRKAYMDNKEKRPVAYKHFSGINASAFRKEIRNLNYLRESLVDQDHIAVHLAAVKSKDDFFIFFDLAPLGDLAVLLNGGFEQSTSYYTEQLGQRKYDFQDKFPAPNMVSFVIQLINLGGALDYIHKLPGNYAHMDLRPNNILVFELTTGKIGKWVLTDFGISHYQPGGIGKELHGSRTLRDFTETITTAGHRILEGTHRAPEIHGDAPRREGLDRQKCDIWSFACIANEVLAFMLGGLGVDKFDSIGARANFWRFHEKRKDSSRYSDYWFELESQQQLSTRPVRAKVRSCIESWFEDTIQMTSYVSPQDMGWLMNFIEVLRFALKTDPAKRPKAGDIVEQLRLLADRMQQPRATLPATLKRTTRSASILQQHSASESWSSHPGSTTRIPHNPVAMAEQTISGNLDLGSNARTPRVSEEGVPKPKITFMKDAVVAAQVQVSGAISQTAESQAHNFRRQGILRKDAPPGLAHHGEQRRSSARSSSIKIQTTTPESSTITERLALPSVPSINDSFRLPKNVEDFEISPMGDKIVFVYPQGKSWKVSLLDLTQNELTPKSIPESQPPQEMQQSQPKIAIASAYMVTVRTLDKKKYRELVNLDTNASFDRSASMKWAQSTSSITPSSSGCFAWAEHKSDSGWLVRIWSPENEVEFPQSLKGTIVRLWFNSVGTFLFVWTRQGQLNRIYTINADDPRAIPIAAVFEGSLQPMNRYSWGCQMRNACIVQEGPTEPQYYIRSDLVTRISGHSDAERSCTAVCDRLMAILHVDTTISLKGIKTAFRVVVRHFNFSGAAGTTRGRFESATDEIPVTVEPVQIKWHSHCKIAAEEKEDGSVRIVVCNWKDCEGRIYTFECPPRQD